MGRAVVVDIGYVSRCSESEAEQILGRTHKIFVFTLRLEDNGGSEYKGIIVKYHVAYGCYNLLGRS